MEELQLALTAGRVDQKNFGLWLKNWQVGQVLQALVTDKTPSGQLVLRIAGQQITATADIPVQKGAVLRLEVNSLSPTPTLKILNATQTAGSGVDPLNGQLQLLIPRQGSVIDPLAILMDPVRSANILSLLGVKSDALAALLRNVGRFEQLTDPRQLRAAVDRSGLFLEPRLLALEHSGQNPLPEDLKADLLKLRQQLDQVLLQSRHDTGKSAINEPLRAFREQVDGAISTITLHQLATRSADQQGSAMWLIHLPFEMMESVHCLSLSISRKHAGSADDEDGNQEWKVLLNVTLPRLGTVEAELYLRGQKLSVVLYSELEDTARLMDNQSHSLRTALESRGMEVSVLLSHQGTRGIEQVMERLNKCVDEKV